MKKVFDSMIGMFTNYPLVCAVVSWLMAQFFKFVTHSVKDKKIDLIYLTTSGGMPSSHTATAVALATAIAKMNGGTDNIPFAIAAVFCFIVMYDATGVRRAAGKHARAINKMADDMPDGKSKYIEETLKEDLGHSVLQVAVGFVFGLVIALLIPEF